MKIMKRNRKRLCRFTIMEMLAASAVFVILMLIVMQIFSTMQDTCGNVQARSETYEEAKNIFTTLTADLQAAVYSDDYAWTYYQPKSEVSGTFPEVSTGFMENPQFWFVTERGDHPSDSDIRMVVCYWLEPVPDPSDPVNKNSTYKTTPERLRYQLCMGLFPSSATHYTDSDYLEEIYSFAKRYVETTGESERRPLPLVMDSAKHRVADPMTNMKIVLSKNILRFDVIPYFQTSTGYEPCDKDDLTILPEALYVRILMVDDTDKARTEFLNAEDGTSTALSGEEREAAREFTRLIQIGGR